MADKYFSRKRPTRSKLAEDSKKTGLSQAVLRCIQDDTIEPTEDEKSKMGKAKNK